MKKTILTTIGATVLAVSSIKAQETRPAEVQPDIVLKADRESAAVGDGVYGTPVGQTIRVGTTGFRPVRFGISVQNDDETEDSVIRFRGSSAGRLFDVRYTIGGRNATAQVLAGANLPIAAGEGVQIIGTGAAERRTRGRVAKATIRYSAGSGALRDSGIVRLLKKPAGARA